MRLNDHFVDLGSDLLILHVTYYIFNVTPYFIKKAVVHACNPRALSGIKPTLARLLRYRCMCRGSLDPSGEYPRVGRSVV